MPSYVKVERDFNPQIVISRWGRFKDKTTSRLRQELLKYLSFYGLEAIKRFMPKGGTGKLEQSLRIYDMSSSYRIMFGIGAEDETAFKLLRILERGSAPHFITPSVKQALSFEPELLRFYQGPSAGGHKVSPMILFGDRIARAYAMHPGIPAYRMFELGMIEIKPEIKELLSRIIHEEIGEVLREK